MLFILEESIFTGTLTDTQIIKFLGNISDSSRHYVIIDNSATQNYLNWRSSLNSSLQYEVASIIDASFRTAALRRFGTTIRVLATNNNQYSSISSFKTTIIAANQLVKNAFRIYVENSRNDKHFILAACTEAQKNRFEILLNKQEIVFINGGGITELEQQLKNDYQSGSTHPAYTWVMFDSDALLPGRPSSQSMNLKKTCLAYDIKHSQLHRRSIENYITKSHLKNWVYGFQKTSNNYQQRTQNFLDYIVLPTGISQHYNMKAGINADRRRTDYPANDSIYAKLEPRVVVSLANGFGKDLSKVFEIPLKESELKAEGSWSELQTMITELEALL